VTGFVLRNRGLSAIVAGVVLLLAVFTVLNRDAAYPQDDLHPENPDPNGARAVARVLVDQGVDVTVAHDEQELLDAGVDGDTTLMVTSMPYLGESTARTLLTEAESAGSVVLAQPPPGLVPGLEVGSSAVQGEHVAGCDDPLLEGLAVDVRTSPTYHVADGTQCFTTGDEALVVRSGTTYAVGGADLFSNHSVTDADNAAVALRLLGQHDRVVWYVPDPADLAAGEGASLSSLLPDWLVPALILLGGASVGLMLWRGRRLGPVVVEPLPVVVRNSEAVEARGRLYRRSRDTAHAAQALRNGTIDRLSAQLAVPTTTGIALLVAEVAQATGRSADDVAGILKDRALTDDAGLVELANTLRTLEREVGRA
jgi:hypothetical protein